jgi:hypothetical protein
VLSPGAPIQYMFEHVLICCYAYVRLLLQNFQFTAHGVYHANPPQVKEYKKTIFASRMIKKPVIFQHQISNIQLPTFNIRNRIPNAHFPTYSPQFLNQSNKRSLSQVLITCSAPAQARRAVATPKCSMSRSLSEWASVLMVSRTPNSIARRA